MVRKCSTWVRTVVVGLVLLLPAAADERYIVRVAAPASASVSPIQSLVSGLINLLGLTVIDSILGIGQTTSLYLISVPSGSNHDAALASLSSDPAVLDLEPDVALGLPEVIVTRTGPTSTPAPPGLFPLMVNYYQSSAWTGYVNQPAAAALNIPAAHNLATGAGIVAILDTGADFSHPVLAPSLISGWDFTTNSAGGSDSTCCQADDPTLATLDDSTTSILDGGWTSILNPSLLQLLLAPPKAYGHGTMVAGLVHLAAPTAQLMPVRVFNSNGTTTLFRIVQGIYYAVDHGATVINMSFSSLTASTELAAAIQYANSHGVIAVSSVGNSGGQVTVYPAGFPQVIAVASTNNSGTLSSFSNYGNQLVTLAAPGEAVVTLYPGNAYAVGWGTSFSTPLVAGGVALLNQLNSADTQSRALQAFSNGSHPSQFMGLGLIDLYQACLYTAMH